MKLSSLTPQDKIKLSAELDGWDYSPISDHASPRPFICHRRQMRVGFDYFKFDTSRDAIIPLIKKQWKESCPLNKEWAIKFIQALYPMHNHPECDGIDLTDAFDDCHQAIYLAMMLSTPSQLRDALLVATGKAEL